MKKSKFIQSTIILMLGGFITKILGMVIKIIMTRFLGAEGIGVYMLISPTFSLFIALAQLGFPVAISKLVAEDRRNNKNLVFSVIPISLIMNLVLMLILIIGGRIITDVFLHEPRTYLGIISIGFVLPFISISSILRGYFFGKEKMFPHVLSNVLEDIVRLILIFLFLPYFLTKGIEITVAFLILSNILSELTSILVFFFFLPKGFKIEKKDFIVQKQNMKDILGISIPTTGSRLIGNIGYFLEPIILTSTLLAIGYSNSFIVKEYGIISGYVLPLLLLPSFFTMAISQALIPVVSKSYSRGNKIHTKKKINQAIFFSLLIGIPITICFELFPEFFLYFLYHSIDGVEYLKILAPICIFHYVQAPLTSALQAMGEAKVAMNGTILGVISRTALLFICSLMKIGLWGLVIATSVNILLVTVHQGRHVKRILKT